MIPPRTITLVLGLSLVIASSWAGTALADDRTIVVAETASAGAEDAAVFKAAARGVKRAIPDAAIADASLADSAFILGCDPGANACRDDVAAQLGYERLVIVSRRGAEVTVAVRARRDGDQRRFSLAQTDKPTLAILESDIAAMLRTPTPDAEEIKLRHGIAKQVLVGADEYIEVPGLGQQLRHDLQAICGKVRALRGHQCGAARQRRLQQGVGHLRDPPGWVANQDQMANPDHDTPSGGKGTSGDRHAGWRLSKPCGQTHHPGLTKAQQLLSKLVLQTESVCSA